MTDVEEGWAVVEDESGQCSLVTADIIEYHGKKWFVPEWVDNQEEGWSTPVRLVRVVQGRTEVPLAEWDPSRGVLPIPGPVFKGRIPSGHRDSFFVVEHPNVRIYGPKGVH